MIARNGYPWYHFPRHMARHALLRKEDGTRPSHQGQQQGRGTIHSVRDRILQPKLIQPTNIATRIPPNPHMNVLFLTYASFSTIREFLKNVEAEEKKAKA